MQSEDDALQLWVVFPTVDFRETDSRLVARAVAEHGQQWAKIALLVGRTDSDCRDRYRNHILDRGKRVIGQSSRAYVHSVTELTVRS